MEDKTGYLGPQGSYSSIAAQRLSGGSEIIPYESFLGLFKALCAGEITAAVLPIENTLNGAVAQNLDLLEETPKVFATAETTVEIEHRLILRDGATAENIAKIYSHPQALAQCSKFLYKKFPHAKQYATSSTSECVKMLVDDSCAGIVGSHVNAKGYYLLDEDISDEKSNFTRFLKVEYGDYKLGDVKGERVFFSLVCRHRPGELCAMLSILARCGINMTKIESRPIKNNPGEFRFFIEIEATPAAATSALGEISERALSCKILGAY